MNTTTNGHDNIRDVIFARRIRRYADYHIAELGTMVRLQSMTELERATIERAAQDEPTTLNARLMIACMVDADGHTLFAADDMDDLLQMDAQVSTAIMQRIYEHCGGKDDTDTAIKNLSATLEGVAQSS